VGGFCAIKQLHQQELVIAQEQRLQRTMLADLQESFGDLARRANNPGVRYAAPAGSGDSLSQASVDLAVKKAMASQAEQSAREQNGKTTLSDAQLEAFAQGEQLLSNAVNAKQWTDADVESWRNLKGRMAGVQTVELIRRLSVAINEGRVSVQAKSPFL
jgi:hypothetical protein